MYQTIDRQANVLTISLNQFEKLKIHFLLDQILT